MLVELTIVLGTNDGLLEVVVVVQGMEEFEEDVVSCGCSGVDELLLEVVNVVYKVVVIVPVFVVVLRVEEGT